MQEKSPIPSKQVALTFDDGPDGKYTPKILDILKQHNVKATFFVVGSQVSKYPDFLKRIHEEGHAIGNHTWDHANLTKLTDAKIKQELKETDDWVEQTVGIYPSMVRAPYGAISASVKETVEKTGRPLIGWNVDPRDWAGTAPKDIIANIQTHTKPGSVILLHCFGGKKGNLDNTVKALPDIIAYLQKEGYQMVTIPDLK
ncbi:hypothetical protein Elgi_32400 [Paenibacillus elgii]|nr:hypothetical protein Elgi_32400 [Paenibacillus elgii]